MGSEKKADENAPAASSTSAADAVKELQEGPKAAADDGMANLIKMFQGDALQKAMSDALQGAGDEGPGDKKADAEGGEMGDFLQNFLKSFETAAGSDDKFADSLSSVMTSMLSNDLICEPLKQIAEHLAPWLQEHMEIPAEDRKRYEQQLDTYRKIIDIYAKNSDPLPEGPREEVQRLLTELHALGQPPDEVMSKITPKEGAGGGEEENFEDFMKTMGLADGLSGEEQDLLKKLSEDPERLTKALQEMAGSMGQGGEDCKQQ